MGKKSKTRIDTSGSTLSFGNDAFRGLAVEGVLPAPAAKSPALSKVELKAIDKKKKRFSLRLDVKREKSGRGGKTVTVIYGTDKLPAHDRKDLLLSLKKKMATGGTIAMSSIEIQGDFADRIVSGLKEMGYNALRSGG